LTINLIVGHRPRDRVLRLKMSFNLKTR
jgi:hypothetical protein